MTLSSRSESAQWPAASMRIRKSLAPRRSPAPTQPSTSSANVASATEAWASSNCWKSSLGTRPLRAPTFGLQSACSRDCASEFCCCGSAGSGRSGGGGGAPSGRKLRCRRSWRARKRRSWRCRWCSSAVSPPGSPFGSSTRCPRGGRRPCGSRQSSSTSAAPPRLPPVCCSRPPSSDSLGRSRRRCRTPRSFCAACSSTSRRPFSDSGTLPTSPRTASSCRRG
mmetsp:Transcript_139/g.438  ORF Transcript_139/g.438 Transcript_139/m.438 type:complete len:223 (+) Transcript_139:485-1153(+)